MDEDIKPKEKLKVLTIRVPVKVHNDAKREAKDRKVSLNKFCAQLIQESIRP